MKPRTLGVTLVTLLTVCALVLLSCLLILASQFKVMLRSSEQCYSGVMPPFRYAIRMLPLSKALCCLLLAACGAAIGAPHVYINHVAPLYYSVNGIPQGLLYDLMTELGRRVQYPGQITPLPLKRLRVMLSSSDEAIGTMWRIPEYESQHLWWCKLHDARFFLVAAPGSTVDISSLDAARHLRVGVIVGSPVETVARNNGFTNIQPTVNAESNLRKLVLGRIDAWIVTSQVLRKTLETVGNTDGTLRTGKEIGRIGLYLASARNFDPREGEKWKSAFESMRKDGSYARIMKRYGAEAIEAGCQ